MDFKLVVLPTDALIYLLMIVITVFILWGRRKQHLRASWRQVIRNKLGIISMMVLSVFMLIGLLDSIHYRLPLPGNGLNGEIHYSSQVLSVLDALLSPIGDNDEKTYSAPFATHLYSKETIELPSGKQVRDYPRLTYGGQVLLLNQRNKSTDIFIRSIQAGVRALTVWLLICISLLIYLTFKQRKLDTTSNVRQTFVNSLKQVSKQIISAKTTIPWRLSLLTLIVLFLLAFNAIELARAYHIFGTDKVGQDVFYQALKSIRTGLVIGTLTTLIMLPFACILGTMAGYFGGLIDDIIQYVYTTLSSIPGVLLIAASILSLQIFITNHPELFSTMAARADARLLALCIILGVTSWTSLCRLLRGETLKLREMDYIQASRALGVGNFKILMRHVIPNVMHIILISIVLDFSGLVLAEAVLSYVGIGVDPSMLSWGNMINSARLELAREPVVWWPLLAAFVFMFILVLAANLFSDAVRDAFDPRIRK